MSEHTLYNSGGVVVTPRLAKINGQTFAIHQISSIQVLTTNWGLVRRFVRAMFICTAILLCTGYTSLYLGRNEALGQSMDAPLAGLGVLGIFGGALFAFVTVMSAIIAWAAKGTVPTDTLQIGTSDGRSVEIAVTSRAVGEAIKHAVERAISGRS